MIIPGTFGKMKAQLKFPVDDGAPIDVLIGAPNVEKLNDGIDLGVQYFNFIIGGTSVWVDLETDRTIYQT